jgi:glycosyltransferase involved in cell wall biosynthesis
LLHVAYRPIGRFIFERSAIIHCVSSAEKHLLLDHFPQLEEKIRVAHNAVDIDAIRTSKPWPVDMPVVLISGRLERHKQIEKMVRAMGLIQTEAIIAVSGDGPLRAALQSQVDSMSSRAHIRLLGHIDRSELGRWQRTADVFLSMSTHEAFGMSAAEAATAGAFVVASDIPAHAELVGNMPGSHTLLPVDSPEEQIAEAVDDALAVVRRGLMEDALSLTLSPLQSATRMESIYGEAIGLVQERSSESCEVKDTHARPPRRVQGEPQ